MQFSSRSMSEFFASYVVKTPAGAAKFTNEDAKVRKGMAVPYLHQHRLPPASFASKARVTLFAHSLNLTTSRQWCVFLLVKRSTNHNHNHKRWGDLLNGEST
jgi:hypothetical protein